MKAAFFLFGLLCSTSLLVANVPSLMSYQGRVTDANGQPIGNAAPVNRSTTFRLYTAASGGTPVYAESQTVTISAGEFSVLIGNGTGVSGQPGPSAPATQPYKTLADVVNTAGDNALFLGITIDDGNASTVDAEISPRQQLVAGAYSLRAKMAEGVADRAVTTAMIADNAITTNQIAAGSINSSKIANNTITTSLIAGSSIDSSKINQNSIGVWTPSGGNIWRNSNVGIRESNPGVPLTFDNSLGNKISLWGNSGTNHYGFGIQGSTLQYYAGSSGDRHAFGYGSSTSFTEWMRLSGGSLGIGTTNPTQRLHVVGDMLATPANWGTSGTTANLFLGDTNNWVRSVFGGGTEMFGINAISLRTGSGAPERIRIQGNGNVGIGTTNPITPLEVSGAINAHDPSVNPDNGYNGVIRLTRPANAAQHINLVRSGNYVWSLGFQPNTSNFGIGPGTGNDGSFNPYFTLHPDARVSINTGSSSEGHLNVGGPLTSVGSRNGRNGYARMYYSNGIIVLEAYNTNLNDGSWRGFSMDGNNDLDWRSDARLKEDIVDAEPMLDRLLQVQFRRYHWINDTNPEEKPEFGVIAQELQPLFPDLVGSREDGYLTVGYTSFGTIAARAIQELSARTDADVTALEDELHAVQEQLADKDARIAELEARLQALENLINKR
ncbi:MAG: tail fiber domain-containing protein [Verrucomicrobiota bacterium JB022]|nr:tail fiber domain-containing protein [Verrucomicrobiota bacterium JB022]